MCDSCGGSGRAQVMTPHDVDYQGNVKDYKIEERECLDCNGEKFKWV